jgi:Rrf2 family nitric oxide-sensitive transcriptional repressor
MRLTTRSSLAMRTLMFCAANPGRLLRQADIAVACNASANHLAQVIHVLGQRGYLHTRRGRGGGLMLARPASEITAGAVLRDFEAPLPFTDCAEGGANDCPLTGFCRLKGVLAEALEAFYAQLDAVDLQMLVKDNTTFGKFLTESDTGGAETQAA